MLLETLRRHVAVSNILFRVQPGAPASLSHKHTCRNIKDVPLQALSPDWVENKRASLFRDTTIFHSGSNSLTDCSVSGRVMDEDTLYLQERGEGKWVDTTKRWQIAEDDV